MHVLAPREFDLFLDLLGEAMSKRRSVTEVVETFSGDGSLRIILEPIPDGGWAVIPTTTGQLSGRDHYVTIRNTFETDNRHTADNEIRQHLDLHLDVEAIR